MRDLSPNAAPLANSVVPVMWSLTFSGVPFVSARWQIPWVPHITQPGSHAACHLFVHLFIYFSSSNHGRYVPTHCRLEEKKNQKAATSWNPWSFAAKWLLCSIWSAHGCSHQHLECGGRKWRADERRLCPFCLCPQVFGYTAETWVAGLFDVIDVVRLCVEAFSGAMWSSFERKESMRSPQLAICFLGFFFQQMSK